MGKKFAPAYANIYMAEWEETLFPKCPHLPAVYYRYLDNIFGIWPHGKHFDNFIQIANSHHEHIKVKATIDPSTMNFLDTTVFTTSITQHFQEAIQVLFKALRTSGYSKRFLRSIKTDTIWELTNHPKPLAPDPKDVIPHSHNILTCFYNFKQ